MTLSINKDVVARAKRFAKKKNKSLSKLAEDYFERLSTPSPSGFSISPLVRKLSGVIRKRIPADSKAAYTEYLEKKYNK